VVDLSDKRIVRDGLEGVEGEEVVEMRYRKVCGTAAWYCASRAKMVAVGPEGR